MMDELLDKVVEWANSKGITAKDQNCIDAQMIKLQEEFYELEEEIDCGNRDCARLELGDILVVCTVIAENLNTDAESCMQLAYDKISKRTGRTVNGTFVKDE